MADGRRQRWPTADDNGEEVTHYLGWYAEKYEMPLTPEVLQEWKELQETCARACCLPTTQVRLYACEHGQTPRGIPMLDLEERGLDVLNGFQFAAEDDALHYRRLCGRSGRRRWNGCLFPLQLCSVFLLSSWHASFRCIVYSGLQLLPAIVFFF